MSLKHLGRAIRGLSGRRRSQRPATARRRRTLLSESLESRQLLAGDLMPAHNYLISEDVNNDKNVTSIDALVVVNALNSNSAVGEFGADYNRFPDVNGDGQITSIDALQVINRVSRGEGVGELLELQLDVSQNGQSIVDENREFSVQVGERFDLELRYSDLRSPFDRLGAFSVYADIISSNNAAFRPVLKETQILTLSGNFENATGGNLIIQSGGSSALVPVLSVDPNVPDLFFAPEAAIERAIEQDLGFGADSVAVTRAIRNPGVNGNVGDDFRYFVRFLNDGNPPTLTLNTGNITGAAVTGPTGTTTFDAEVIDASDPRAFALSIDTRSSSLNDEFVYTNVVTGQYLPNGAEVFNEVGGTGPVDPGGLRNFAQNQGVTFTGVRFEAYSIEIEAIAPVTEITFQVDLPDDENLGSELSLYGRDEVLEPGLVLIDLDDDPAIAGDDRFGLVRGNFGGAAGNAITAGIDSLTINEDSTPTAVNVLANDSTTNPGPLSVTSISQGTNGAVTLVNGVVSYSPNPDFFGQDSFNYVVSDGVTTNTGTVNVTVLSVNDPPTARGLTVTVPVAGSIAIPFSDFLNPQPGNENDVVNITSATPNVGNVQVQGRTLLYTASGNPAITSDAIQLVLSDGEDTAVSTINVNISSATTTVANNDVITVNEDQATVINLATTLFANDSAAAGNASLSSLGTAGTLGTLDNNNDGTITYTPPGDAFGAALDSFTYVIVDSNGGISNTATVTVNVAAVNDTPIASDVGVLLNTANSSSLNLNLANEISAGIREDGVPGQTVQITDVGAPSNGGTAGLQTGQSILYTPAIGFTGIETFTYTVADQGGLTATGTVTVTVSGSGNAGTASISGVKFNDANENNTRDAGEATLPGWTIYLDLNGNEILDGGEPSTLTDSTGAYAFNNLPSGSYTVREVQRAGWRQTFPLGSGSSDASFQTGVFAGFTKVADIDSDGDSDVIVANDYSDPTQFQSSVTVLTNNGDGTFAESTLSLPNHARPQAVYVGDLTGDGVPDLAVASAGTPLYPSAGTDGVHIFSSSFATNPRFIPTGGGPSDISGADLNGDGSIDLVTTNYRSNDISVLLGTGGGNFSAPAKVAVGNGPIALSLGDVNGDGRSDVAVANYESNSVSVLLGTGGSFTLGSTVSGISNPTDVLLIETTGDTALDLVATETLVNQTGSVKSYQNSGAGIFSSLGSFGVSGSPESISGGDMDRDGRTDLMVANRRNGASALRNTGGGRFAATTDESIAGLPTFPSSSLPKSIDIANLDGDNIQDYVVAFHDGGVSIHTSEGSTSPGAYSVTLADGQSTNGRDFGNFQFSTTQPTVSLTASTLQMNETGGGTTITATLSQALSSPVTVNLGLAGTATLNADYSASTTQIVIPAGSLSATSTLSSIGDSIDEANETINVTAASVTGASSDGSQVAITIIDDDDVVSNVTLTANPTSVNEGGSANLTATLSSVLNQDVRVNLAYSGTATNNVDFAGPASIVIPAGQTTAIVTVTTADDFADESNESIVVEVTSVVGATENGNQSAAISIIDNDGPPPTATLSTSGATITEGVGTTSIIATLSSPAPQQVVLDILYTGTATNALDYTAPQQIFIPAGNTTGSIIVGGLDDTIDEPIETIVATISGVTGATITSPQSVTISVLDDDDPVATLSTNFTDISEDGGVATVFATLSSTTDIATNLNLVLGGTAVEGTDYIISSKTLSIAANTTVDSLQIQAINNQDIENENKTIEIGIAGSTAAPLVITILNEDGVSFPLRAAGTAMDGFGTIVTEAEVQELYDFAVDIWKDAGLDEHELNRLRVAEVSVEDLDGDLLGLGGIDRVVIDVNAAGFGWFIDDSPEEDSEFNQAYFSDVNVTMDLLTVILHEQGHIIGLDDGSSELMLERLAAGSRRMPSSTDIDNAINDLF